MKRTIEHLPKWCLLQKAIKKRLVYHYSVDELKCFSGERLLTLFCVPKSTVSSLLFVLLLTLMLLSKHASSLTPQGMSPTPLVQKISIGKLHKEQILYEHASGLWAGRGILIYSSESESTHIGLPQCPGDVCMGQEVFIDLDIPGKYKNSSG